MSGIELCRIPVERYAGYRREVIFRAYKWDPQVGDQNTVAEHVIVLDAPTARQLELWTEQLAAETVQMEKALMNRPDLVKKLGYPHSILKALKRLGSYDSDRHVRLMRFDFHPTTSGWAISEVNSDVPGGLAEASVLPRIAGVYFPDCRPRGDVAQRLLESFRQRVAPGARIAFIHATSYSDDRQVMQFLGDTFEANGYRPVYAAPDHLVWDNRRAICVIEGEEGPIDGIVRFFPLEWLDNLPRTADWRGFYDTVTASCNHPAAILTQSKRLPLVWDALGAELPTWKALLPETKPSARRNPEPDWILKPAMGRVGEGISIAEAIPPKEFAKICKAARRNPTDWVAQKKFTSQPITEADGTAAFHLCIGSFAVDGKASGFYGRISPYPRIDDKAKDIPILVKKEGE